LTSTVLSTAIVAINNRRKTKADIFEGYADRLEKRIDKLEKRTNVLEQRDIVFTETIGKAYRCPQRNDCPVVDYLTQHPLPEKQ